MNIEQLREIALSLPHATEDVKWENDLCFCIGEKMFCATNLNGPFSGATLKVTPEDYVLLIEQGGCVSAPYIGRYKWVQTTPENRWTEQEWTERIRASYDLVKSKLPKRLQNALQ